jgi:hypothetical protein
MGFAPSRKAARQLVENSKEANWQQAGWGLAGRGERDRKSVV